MSTDDTTQNTTELQITEADDGSVSVTGFEDETTEAAAPSAATSTAAHDDEDDDDDDNDSRTTERGPGSVVDAQATETEETREQIRERRRRERQEKRQRQREREERTQLELEAARLEARDLRRRLEIIETRGQGSELAQIDARIADTTQNIAYLENVIRDATTSQNGEALAKATTQLQREILAEKQLKDLREAYATSQPRRALPDPRVVLHGKRWMSAHNWYNPASQDPDSQQALLIDRRLAAEGADPSTPEYWEELTKRVRAAMPHRFTAPAGQTETPAADNGYNAAASHGKPKRSVVAGSGGTGSASGASAPKGYVLSSERVQALKDAGMWDDPKTRADAIRRYREHDAQKSA